MGLRGALGKRHNFFKQFEGNMKDARMPTLGKDKRRWKVAEKHDFPVDVPENLR